MEKSPVCFGVGIKALREHGWKKRNQKEIANGVCSETHLAQIFQGKRNPSPELQDKLAIEYGVHTEDIIKIGRMILKGEGFFPFIGQIEDLIPNSEAQASKIVKLTNKAFGIEGCLKDYRPESWDSFVSRKINPKEFYKEYSKELGVIAQKIRKIKIPE